MGISWDEQQGQLRDVRRERTINLIALAVILTLVTFVVGVQVGMATERGRTVCTEDMACWDCHTMGNQVCGPVRP